MRVRECSFREDRSKKAMASRRQSYQIHEYEWSRTFKFDEVVSRGLRVARPLLMKAKSRKAGFKLFSSTSHSAALARNEEKITLATSICGNTLLRRAAPRM